LSPACSFLLCGPGARESERASLRVWESEREILLHCTNLT
jgi:hypothetical protein